MARKTRASVPDPPPRPAPVTVQKPDPEVWALALEAVDGDVSRLEVQDGGKSVVVRNNPK